MVSLGLGVAAASVHPPPPSPSCKLGQWQILCNTQDRGVYKGHERFRWVDRWGLPVGRKQGEGWKGNAIPWMYGKSDNFRVLLCKKHN